MKTEEIKTVKIEFDGDEADKFKSAVKKLTNETGRAGFSKNSDLNADEIKLIRDIDEKINPK
jgi:hypothetical protein